MRAAARRGARCAGRAVEPPPWLGAAKEKRQRRHRQAALSAPSSSRRPSASARAPSTRRASCARRCSASAARAWCSRPRSPARTRPRACWHGLHESMITHVREGCVGVVGKKRPASARAPSISQEHTQTATTHLHPSPPPLPPRPTCSYTRMLRACCERAESCSSFGVDSVLRSQFECDATKSAPRWNRSASDANGGNRSAKSRQLRTCEESRAHTRHAWSVCGLCMHVGGGMHAPTLAHAHQ